MLTPGRIVGSRYRLTELMGTGGMATVWAATHLELSTPVAVKFQKTWVTGDRAAEEKFKREARAAARLKSPHIVHVYDYGVDDGVPYIVMELLHGESLRHRLNRSAPLPAEEVLRWVRQAAKALDFAHKSGVVHRDVKPSNLFSARDGDDEIVKLLDFGIARSSDTETTGDATDSAVIVGSVAYMSREQARGEPTGSQSDVWSLAIVAYEALFGETPFQGANVPDTLARINAGKFRLPSSFARGYENLDSLFEAALNPEPHERSPSAGAFATELARKLDLSSDAAVSSYVPRGRSDDTATLNTHVKTHRPARASRGFTALAVFVAGSAAVFALLNAARSPSPTEAPKSSAEPAATTTIPRSANPPPDPAPSAPLSTAAAAAPPPAPSAPKPEASRDLRSKVRATASSKAAPAGSGEKKPAVSDPMFGIDITR
jgi:eukaryotic-like serine/threonine-protein kinase